MVVGGRDIGVEGVLPSDRAGSVGVSAAVGRESQVSRPARPAVIGEKKDGDNEQDADLGKFSNSIRKIAQETGLPLCDLRKLFLDYNIEYNKDNAEKGILTTDRVHLNKAGNALVAKSLSSIIEKI